MLTLRFDSSLPKYEIIHGIHIHRIGFTKRDATISNLRTFPLFLNKYYYQMFAGFYALWLNRTEKFDAVWAMMAHSCGVPAGIFKLMSPKTKYILTLQEGDPPEHIEKMASPFFPPISTISYWFFKNGFKRADMMQTISTFLLNWGRSMGFSGYGVVIPNAVDVKKFIKEIPSDEIEKVKNKLGKKDGETWLITTSRLVHKNAVDDCINAIKLLPENYHFAILGIGPDEGKLKKLVKDLNIENRIHFVGEVKHPELVTYLRACDIFIRPSRSEGMGNSFVEAMSLKMPVIATTEGGLSDFIFDGQTAFVCQKDNPQSIVSAINKIHTLREGGQLQKVLETAYKMVVEKYDWDLIAKRMDQEIFSKI
jgi:glycosyltransferase involved in cell wall biosynthesis